MSQPNYTEHTRPSKQEIREALAYLQVLLFDALQAGSYLAPGEGWQPGPGGGMTLTFTDRAAGHQHPGRLVFAEHITPQAVKTSINNSDRSCVLLGGWLDDAVKLGEARYRRTEHTDGAEQYWATYVLDKTILVASGAPSSACRLIGEIINLQMPTPFVQRRICPHCYTLNTYYSRRCTACGHSLAATGATA